MNRIRISVIVPVYNVGVYLPECLNSLLVQTCSDIEIICINDGSTDNSAMVLEAFAEKDKRIKVINQPNAGVGAARNTGLAAAGGEYVCFVDPDDFITPDYLQGLLDAVSAGDYDIAANENVIFYHERQCCKNEQRKTRFPAELEINKETLSRRCGRTICWNKIYRRGFLLEHEILFPPCRLAEDQYFYFVSMINAKKMAFSDRGMYFYRQRDNSLVGQMKKKLTTNEHLEVAERIFDYCQARKLPVNFYFPLSLLKTHVRMSFDKKKAVADTRKLLRKLIAGGIQIRPKDRWWVFRARYLPFVLR